MENEFSVNYDLLELALTYNDQDYYFDLSEGDAGDYWQSIIVDGQVLDINFVVFNDGDTIEEPTLSIYKSKVNQDGFLITDTSGYVVVPLNSEIGNREAYLSI